MKSNAIAVMLMGLLAACAPDSPVGDSTANGTADAPPPASNASGAPAYPADYAIDAPIPVEDLDYRLSLEAGPGYRADGDALVFNVGIENLGKAALVSAGTQPVNLGAYVVPSNEGGEHGNASREGASRSKLPLLVPGEKVIVEMRMPAADVVAQQVRAELVQERVAWMGRRYGKPVLDIGSFQRCAGTSGALCDAAGVPLPER